MTYNDTKKGCAPACQDGNKYVVKPENRCSTTVTATHLFWHHRTNERYTNTSPYASRFYSQEHKHTNTVSKAGLAVYGIWFALIVDINDYEGEFYPETKVPTYQEIRAWIKQKYGFNTILQ